MNNPYKSLPVKNFWGKAVRDKHYYDLEELSKEVDLRSSDKIATAGSCFAQHIGRHLRMSGFNYLDMEPKPEFVPEEKAKKFGYNVYSCRYGNIYSTRQLLQLTQEALGHRKPYELVWKKGKRYFDALRPSVDPAGYDSEEDVIKLRERHLQAVAKMLSELDVFVFTLGLTETWVSKEDGTAYPTAAGTIVGEHDPKKYELKNLRYNDVYDDLKEFFELVRTVNKDFRVILTVSPVPLNATASDDHVLVASSRSKSVLRSVAGDISEDYDNVYYFPSYEIISSHPSRGMFFEPNLREVNDAGVRYVMQHFFKSFGGSNSFLDDKGGEDDEVICDEEALDKF